MALTPLFDSAVPSGFRYEREFIGLNEEAGLVDAIGRVEFSNFEMRGVVARRRVAFFGRSYDSDGAVTPPLPAFLLPLREKVASWAGRETAAFEMALINEYPPGAPIGWHRDAPQYDVVAGISLLSACRMRFRERRSAYLLTGPSRTAYEHHIPAVEALRYSITFRTLRS